MIDRRGTTREKSRHRSQPEIQRGKRQAKGRYPPRGSLDRHHDNTASHHDATNADEHGHSQSTDHQPAGGAAVAEMRVARLDRLAAWCPRGRFGYAAASGASGCVGFQAGWAAARISGRTWVARAWCGTPGGACDGSSVACVVGFEWWWGCSGCGRGGAWFIGGPCCCGGGSCCSWCAGVGIKIWGAAVAVYLHRCPLCEGISPAAGDVSAIGGSMCRLPRKRRWGQCLVAIPWPECGGIWRRPGCLGDLVPREDTSCCRWLLRVLRVWQRWWRLLSRRYLAWRWPRVTSAVLCGSGDPKAWPE